MLTACKRFIRRVLLKVVCKECIRVLLGIREDLLSLRIMFNIVCWNVRGLNALDKQQEVRSLISNYGVHVCAVLESHVKPDNLQPICDRIFRRWPWISNQALCTMGTRILVAWDNVVVDLMVLETHAQYINCELRFRDSQDSFFVSFVYAANRGCDRGLLWSGLRRFKVIIGDKPWVVAGDFNCLLFPHDALDGVSRRNADMMDFAAWVEDVELFDVRFSGVHHTWCQKPREEAGLRRKLDRILANTVFTSKFEDATARFLPRGLSDHSPGLLSFRGDLRKKNFGFKFDNFLVHDPRFIDIVKAAWKGEVTGTFMYRLTTKLKRLKTPIRRLRSLHGNLSEKSVVLKSELDTLQLAMDLDPNNGDLREDLEHVRLAYQQSCWNDMSAARQRAKVKWLSDGDSNTRYFHQVVKEKRHAKQIYSVCNSDGTFVYDGEVAEAFIEHFKLIIGTSDPMVDPTMPQEMFLKQLSLADALHMIRPIQDAEIKDAIFQIGNDKAPGSDGFSAKFFKAAWEVIGTDVLLAIHNFFYRGRLAKELNHTLLCLLPKSVNASAVADFRPIACCSVLYKCIAKVIVERIKPYLDTLVSKSQSAFIPGRRITDNILMAHELVIDYHLNKGPPRCAFKIDLRKAYDMDCWEYLFQMLNGMSFHPMMLKWIKEMVSSTSFSIVLNGETHGHFVGKRGIRQGDPLSPYLFTIIMEGFTMILNQCIMEASNFGYHQGCADLGITHLCFADDLFVFSRGDVESVGILKKALELFSVKSGLSPNMHKSDVFFGNVPDDDKAAILNCLPFRQGTFPIRYLGVPLSPVALKVADYGGMIAKVTDRIRNWKSKFLSFAGRRQLVISVLQSLQLYWMAVYVFPSVVVHQLEALFRDFLWSHGDSSRGRCKLAWSLVCHPLDCGGLGIKRLGVWNRAIIAKNVWDVLTKRNTLWVRWIHTHALRGCQFWSARRNGRWSWMFYKMMAIRSELRPYISNRVGDGRLTNAWEDSWLPCGPLVDVISYRAFHAASFSTTTTVRQVLDVIQDEWPSQWLERYPQFALMDVPEVNDVRRDVICWDLDDRGNDDFTVQRAYSSFRGHQQRLPWARKVWFKGHIPKHAFCMWLVCLCRLPTQDRLVEWKHDPPDYRCSLCNQCMDSYTHLFFDCLFAKEVWNWVKMRLNWMDAPDTWDMMLDYLSTPVVSSLTKLLALSATVYMIWNERNRRLFKGEKLPSIQIMKNVLEVVQNRIAWKRRKQRNTIHDVETSWALDRLGPIKRKTQKHDLVIDRYLVVDHVIIAFCDDNNKRLLPPPRSPHHHKPATTVAKKTPPPPPIITIGRHHHRQDDDSSNQRLPLPLSRTATLSSGDSSGYNATTATIQRRRTPPSAVRSIGHRSGSIATNGNRLPPPRWWFGLGPAVVRGFINNKRHHHRTVVWLAIAKAFNTTVVGYFLGSRIPFPIVQRSLRAAWGKFGFTDVMMNNNGFFFMKFNDVGGCNQAIEEGMIMIRDVPMFVSPWDPSKGLSRPTHDVCPLWVKFHNIPLVLFNQEGISRIATALGVPRRMDACTSSMCDNRWGRPRFARVLIDVWATGELKKELEVITPHLKDGGCDKIKIGVEYVWEPNQCSHCCVFGHKLSSCAKAVPVNHKKSQPEPDADGFVRVERKQWRGLNSLEKQQEVKSLIRNNNVHVCAVLESHVRVDSLRTVCSSTFGRWDWVSNQAHSDFGKRIILAWDADCVDVMLLEFHRQFVHCQICVRGAAQTFFLSVVYGDNRGLNRRMLWSGLRKFKAIMGAKPWVIAGDFNCLLFPHDALGGVSRRNSDMDDFALCLEDIEVFDLRFTGIHHTWCQKPQSEGGLKRKLDRILANTDFTSTFEDASSRFLPRGLSDHSPGLLAFTSGVRIRKCAFKFDNFLVNDPNFKSIVRQHWNVNVEGTFMFRVTSKLKLLKSPLRKLRSTYGNLSNKSIALKEELDVVQLAADLDPGNQALENDVKRLRDEYQKSCWADFSAKRQRAKVRWLAEGDANTRYFHRVIQERQHARHIFSIGTSEGVFVHDDQVASAFIDHFVAIIGTKDDEVVPTMPDSLFESRLSVGDANHMIRQVEDAEIKEALFSIGNDKSPGSDGFSSKFYKAAWDIVGPDVLVAIHNFFYRGRLAKELNHTLLCLLPKSPNASLVSDFRPIACCSVLYKCISKVIVNRIKPCLDRLVNRAQSAFIPGRRIGDNILMAHELVTGYHLGSGPPRCALKIDLRKAYDMVSWDYLFGMLRGLNFHPTLVKWITEMVSTPTYSVVVNSEAKGFFHGKRGIRQGDPLSPYLFTIVMEGFSMLLQQCIEEAGMFGYHLGCENLGITHLCFADDLFVFTRGDVASVEVVKKALSLFASRSGLTPNLQKSDIFFGNVPDDVRSAILHCLPFRSGTFPIRYLGVPLSPVALKAADYGVLITKVKQRLQNWKSKFLSFGGRKQLICSVLQSLQLYWMAIFLLPSGIVHDLERLFRDFLWAQGESSKGRCKVAWAMVCRSQECGGLGFRRLAVWNRALIAKNLWAVISNRQCLWVAWVQTYSLRNGAFWIAKRTSRWSWLLTKMMSMRSDMRRFVTVRVGDGRTSNAWEDAWLTCGILSEFISYRFIHSVGLSVATTVKELLDTFNDGWPDSWVVRFPILTNVTIPVLQTDTPDTLCWDVDVFFFKVKTGNANKKRQEGTNTQELQKPRTRP
ncbi:hypothetical protein OSB04_028246 [Centaurea solstitialis]|uniref:Reverse transcriptase domain-containing protein n=1 Tax=Centaurea solstitialis TaxID=347529 RepID=A0AA38SFC8_9ASTR|nr:hypothetical protein OSB04_028246 [Centaurea solstitialis]